MNKNQLTALKEFFLQQGIKFTSFEQRITNIDNDSAKEQLTLTCQVHIEIAKEP